MAKLKLTFPTLRQPSTVVTGTGSLAALRDAADLDNTAFFLSGHNSVKAALERVLNKVDRELTSTNHIIKPSGEPTSEMIRFGSAFLRNKLFTRIVGIGGGSTLDWCRLALADLHGALDMASGHVTFAVEDTLPELWLVPTTPATGAEAAQVAVYQHASHKLAATSPAFIADQVVLDARFVDSLSPHELAASLCDTLSHGIEAYCSIVPQHLAKESAIASLELVFRHFGSAPSRSRNERLLEAGFLGGVAASNCSVGVIHAFAHSVAHLGIPHRLGNALALTAGLQINATTDAVGKLVKRLKMNGVEQLVAAITPITEQAIRTNKASAGISQLREQATRNDVICRMLEDVCLRSNPQPLDQAALQDFLAHVEGAIRSA